MLPRKRRAVHTFAVVAVLAVPLAIASLAFACARLATLKLDRAGGRPGAETNAVGVNFNNNAESSPVAIRFNSRNGRILWQGRADRRGRIKGSFKIPNARPGDYVIVATQQTAEGRPAAGTPGRAPLEIRGKKTSRKRSSSTGAAPPPVGGTSGPQGGGPSAGPAVLISSLLLLMAGAAGAVMVAGRRRTAPATR